MLSFPKKIKEKLHIVSNFNDGFFLVNGRIKESLKVQCAIFGLIDDDFKFYLLSINTITTGHNCSTINIIRPSYVLDGRGIYITTFGSSSHLAAILQPHRGNPACFIIRTIACMFKQNKDKDS